MTQTSAGERLRCSIHFQQSAAVTKHEPWIPTRKVEVFFQGQLASKTPQQEAYMVWKCQINEVAEATTIKAFV